MSTYFQNLTPHQKLLQARLISQSQEHYEKTGEVKARPKVSDRPSPRSTHARKFENKYGFKVTETAKVKRLFPDTDVDKILAKGKGAYMTSGSRPNQTPDSWANARLASVLTGGNALKVDKDLVGPKSLQRIRGTSSE